MVASIQSPADLANLAFARIGFKGVVGNLYDGSAQARATLRIYAQTRDELLRQNDWDFAERNLNMALLKQAPPGGYLGNWTPAFPPLPWLFEYSYPGDCLKVRSVRPPPIFVMNFDPQPNVYEVSNDNSFNPAQKVISCNVASAILTYTGQITDPATWEADFCEAFAAVLGRRLAPGLVNTEAAKLAAADESQSTAMAESEQG